MSACRQLSDSMSRKPESFSVSSVGVGVELEQAPLPSADEQKKHASEKECRDHGNRVEESCLDDVIEKGAQHRRGKKGDHQIEEELPPRLVSPEQSSDHLRDSGSVETQHGENRATLDDDVERVDRDLGAVVLVEAHQP